MSKAFRLGVVVAPSPHLAAWRTAIAARCLLLGWRLEKSAVEADDGRNAVLLVKGLHHVRPADADQWVVIGGSAAEFLATASEGASVTAKEASRLASAQLAALSELIADGALHFGSGQFSLDLPELGGVSIQPGDVDVKAVALPPELEIYERIPPQVGASAVWAADVFDYTLKQEPTGGSPEIELTGRGRILVHGPYLELPPGLWRITVRFTVFPDDIAYLLFEWGVGAEVTPYRAEVTHEGAYELVIDHALAARGPMELRVWAERGHFMGRMKMGDCQVERVAPDA